MKTITHGYIERHGKGYRYGFDCDGELIRKGGFQTKAQASLAMERHKRELVEGGAYMVPIGTMDAYDEYLVDIEGINSDDWHKSKVCYGKHFKRHFGNNQIQTISEFTVNKYKMKRAKEKNPRNGNTIKQSTVDKELAVLKHYFGWCVSKNYLKENPATKVKKFNVDNTRDKTLTLDQVRRLKEAATFETRLRIILVTSYGARGKEIKMAKWENLDRRTGKLTLQRTKKRSTEYYEIELPPELVDMLDRLPRARRGKRVGYIFPHDECKRSFATALFKSGIASEEPDFHFHDLRHVAGTWQQDDGASLKAIQKFLGHSDIKMTMKYLHVDKQVVSDMGKNKAQLLIS